MGKSYGLCDFRIGKVGNLVFRKVENKNIISEKPKYYPVNSAWLTREEFKQYVLSLFDIAVPQLYLFDELPEDIFPYALLFIQNGDVTDVYLDKDGKRTQLHIGDGGGSFEPTQDQLLAMNSGITQPKREGYDLAVIGVDDLKTRMLVAEEGIGALETALDGKSDKNTTYTKTEVNELVDRLDTAIDQLDMEFSTLSDTKLNKRTSVGLGVYCHNGTTQGELLVRTYMFSTPSDTAILTEKAIKTYADSIKADVNNKLDKRTNDGIWLYSHSNEHQGEFHVLPVVENVATDFDILTAKAVKTYVDSQTVYNHQLSLRFNDGYCKASIVLFNKKSTELSITEVTTILKNGFHNPASGIIGMLAGVLPAVGFYKLNGVWYNVIGVVYNDDTQHVVAVGRQYSNTSGANALVLCDAHNGVYTLTDIVSST